MQQVSLEQQIFSRLQERRSQYSAGAGLRDSQLESMIYDFLYQNLRCVAAVLPGLGRRAVNPRLDASCRFTSVLNEAFTRILDRCPEKLHRAQTRSQLTGYVSRIMVNLMIDHERRESTWNKVAERLGLTAEDDYEVRDILSHLCDDRRDYFEQRTQVRFAAGLEQIRSWDNSTDPGEQQYAAILRKRYIDQLGYAQIAVEMQLSRTEVENMLERARYHLRKRCGGVA